MELLPHLYVVVGYHIVDRQGGLLGLWLYFTVLYVQVTCSHLHRVSYATLKVSDRRNDVGFGYQL